METLKKEEFKKKFKRRKKSNKCTKSSAIVQEIWKENYEKQCIVQQIREKRFEVNNLKFDIELYFKTW